MGTNKIHIYRNHVKPLIWRKLTSLKICHVYLLVNVHIISFVYLNKMLPQQTDIILTISSWCITHVCERHAYFIVVELFCNSNTLYSNWDEYQRRKGYIPWNMYTGLFFVLVWLHHEFFMAVCATFIHMPICVMVASLALGWNECMQFGLVLMTPHSDWDLGKLWLR